MPKPHTDDYKKICTLDVDFHSIKRPELFKGTIYSTNIRSRSCLRLEANLEVMYFYSVGLFNYKMPFKFTGFHYDYGISNIILKNDGHFILQDDINRIYDCAWQYT